MKIVKDIPANTLVEMTLELYQEFAQGGCVPACHLTHKWINIGDKFHLSSVDKKQIEDPENKNPMIYSKIIDVMLAEKSTVKKYITYQQKLEKERLRRIADNRKEATAQGRTGCFRINGKIVH
jgi:hypothetical protein